MFNYYGVLGLCFVFVYDGDVECGLWVEGGWFVEIGDC